MSLLIKPVVLMWKNNSVLIANLNNLIVLIPTGTEKIGCKFIHVTYTEARYAQQSVNVDRI